MSPPFRTIRACQSNGVRELQHGDVIMWPESPCAVAEVVSTPGGMPELRWPGQKHGSVVWDGGADHVVVVLGNIRHVEQAGQQRAERKRTSRTDPGG